MRHRSSAATLAVFLASVLAIPVGARAAAAATQDLPFAWRIAELGGSPNQRVAISVTARLDGRSCTMQLDTGLDSAVVWNGSAPSVHEDGAKVRVEFAGVTHSLTATPARLKALAACTTDGDIGSLGNGFFDQGTLRVDLKAARIAYTPGSMLSDRPDAYPMFYVQWGDSGGHVLVETTHDDGARGYAMLDTGSASADLLVLTKAHWQRDTGGAAMKASAQVRRFEIPAWGRMHECFAAAAKQSIAAGGIRLRTPEVTFCPDLGFEFPLRIEGVLGMHAFEGGVITIDYVARRWIFEPAR